jgi:hypothetical protein
MASTPGAKSGVGREQSNDVLIVGNAEYDAYIRSPSYSSLEHRGYVISSNRLEVIRKKLAISNHKLGDQ